jgi:NAD+ kinase
MKTIGIIANIRKPRARDVLRRIEALADQFGLTLIAEPEAAQLMTRTQSAPREDIPARTDAILALGGDGTMLRAIRELDGIDKPVLGVNIGSLGFLTNVSESELEHAMECLALDHVSVSPSPLIECSVVRQGHSLASYRAVNDVVVRTGAVPRMVTLDVSLDDDPVTSYRCDGLIVATPAGSTGHSLSAGGPILTPETHAFLLSLICPHTLSTRPIVFPDQSRVCVRISHCAGDLQLSVDGQVGQSLGQEDIIEVKRSGRDAQFLRLPGHSYFRVLREKLRWSGRNV